MVFIAMVILSGVPESFARPQYLNSFNEVYGNGSCETCHVMTSGGPRDYNGTFGQHNNSNRSAGQYNDTNRTFSRNGNRTSRQGNSNRTLQLNSYGTLFENQPDHATDPGAALGTIGRPSTSKDIISGTTGTSNGAQAAPGFGFTASLVGLFAYTLLSRRNNK